MICWNARTLQLQAQGNLFIPKKKMSYRLLIALHSLYVTTHSPPPTCPGAALARWPPCPGGPPGDPPSPSLPWPWWFQVRKTNFQAISPGPLLPGKRWNAQVINYSENLRWGESSNSISCTPTNGRSWLEVDWIR